jgi:hypothetical protein
MRAFDFATSKISFMSRSDFWRVKGNYVGGDGIMALPFRSQPVDAVYLVAFAQFILFCLTMTCHLR